MEAITAPEHAQIQQTVKGEKVQSDHLIEPLTNYFVGRLKQSVLKGNSTVGLIATTVNRWDSNTAYVGGLDWDLRFANDMSQITGTLAGSQAGEPDARKSGYIALLEIDKKGGLRGETYLDIAAEAQFKNYWEWTLGVGRNFESLLNPMFQ